MVFTYGGVVRHGVHLWHGCTPWYTPNCYRPHWDLIFFMSSHQNSLSHPCIVCFTSIFSSTTCTFCSCVCLVVDSRLTFFCSMILSLLGAAGFSAGPAGLAFWGKGPKPKRHKSEFILNVDPFYIGKCCAYPHIFFFLWMSFLFAVFLVFSLFYFFVLKCIHLPPVYCSQGTGN